MDKAVSVGEKSTLEIKNSLIRNSEIGFAIKDYSKAYIQNSKIEDTNICVSSFQKKQEYGGGFAKLENLICDGNLVTDKIQ